MKRHSILLAALCALLLMVPGESRAASVYKLSMTTLYPTTHPTCANVWLPWIRQINRETNGRVVINYFDPNTICPNNEMYASVVSGAVDIAGHLCGATPGKFPSMEAPALPLLVESALAGSLTVWDFYDREEQAKKDFRDVKILWMWSSADFHIQTISRPVRTLEDIRGLKLICWTQDNAELCKALGGIPINIPTQDTYLALQRGMADGLLTPIASMRSYKTSEVCTYTTRSVQPQRRRRRGRGLCGAVRLRYPETPLEHVCRGPARQCRCDRQAALHPHRRHPARLFLRRHPASL